MLTRVASVFPSGTARPFIKWAGGKTQLIPELAPLYPAEKPDSGYHEPFVGSGAVFFDVTRRARFARRILTDANPELIATWKAVQTDVPSVIEHLAEHRRRHSKTHYYETRAIDLATLDRMPLPERGARFIYLNKTCFNGLYRVNSRGIFNVPMGDYDKPAICDPKLLHEASAALRGVDFQVAQCWSVLERVHRGDFVYFDPPYVPLSRTANFTAYTGAEFGESEQEQLAAVFRSLTEAGCFVMLSNSDTPLVRKLYRGFAINPVKARRSINSKANGRGHVGEVVVINYTPGTRRTSARRRTGARKTTPVASSA